MTVFSPDNNDLNADWSKTTWDLPKTVAGFMAFLAGKAAPDSDVVTQWVAFQKRPSARAMPKELRAEVEAILFGGLPVTMVDNAPRQVGDDGAPSTR